MIGNLIKYYLLSVSFDEAKGTETELFTLYYLSRESSCIQPNTI